MNTQQIRNVTESLGKAHAEISKCLAVLIADIGTDSAPAPDPTPNPTPDPAPDPTPEQPQLPPAGPADPPKPRVTTAYTTFGPDGAYNTASGIRVADPKSKFGPHGACEFAIPFTPVIPGRLAGVVLAIGRALASTTSDTLRCFSIRHDQGGGLGDVISKWEILPDLECTLTTLHQTSPLPTTDELSPYQRYWLVAEINPEGTAGDTWYQNSCGIRVHALARRSQSDAWQSTEIFSPAFSVQVAID